MKRFNLLVLLVLLPVIIFAQFVVNPGYQISFKVKNSTLGRIDSMGMWVVKGGFDINKNGKKEILGMTDWYSSRATTKDTTISVVLLENDGNDNYKLIWSTKLPYSSNQYGDICVADVDRDDKDEIWVSFAAATSAAVPNPPRLVCYEYDGTRLPTSPTLEWNYGLKDKFDFRASCLMIEDIDGDNEVEIITTSRKDDYTGSGAGRTVIIASLPIPIEPGGLNIVNVEMIDTSKYLQGGAIYEAKIIDYDSDGKKELWVFTWDMCTINIFEANGKDKYSHEVEIRKATTPLDIGSLSGTQFYDMNGDGKLEGFIAGTTSSLGQVYMIESTTDVSKLTVASIKPVGYNVGGDPRGSAIGDFDKNGKGDFVFVDRKFKKVVKMEYKGTGSLSDSTSYTWTDLLKDTSTVNRPDFWQLSASTADMDGDGYVELLLPNLSVLSSDVPSIIMLEAKKTTDVKKIDGMPVEYSLNQNYPNPFNPTTQIEFVVPASVHVSLKVFNMLGQEVSTLVNEMKDAGRYIATFTTKNLPSGTYYYKINAGDFSEVKKMMLMK